MTATQAPDTEPYQQVIWEPQAYREPGKTEKALFSYDQSLERLQRVGFERHPRSDEVNSLLIGHLEGRLSSGLVAVAEDMLRSFGERYCMLWLRTGKTLTEFLEQGGSPMHYTRREFNIGNLPSETFLNLNDVPEDVVTSHYTRPLNQLPREMRTYAKIVFPPEGVIRPVGRGGFGWFVVNGFNCSWASRGVRRASAAAEKTVHH